MTSALAGHSRFQAAIQWLGTIHGADYLAAKGRFLGPFSVVATFIAALFVFSNLAWDYAVDPEHAGDVVGMRLVQALAVLLLALVIRHRPTGPVARIGMVLVAAFVQISFIEILRQLDGGASYGIGAFLYFFIFVPFIGQAQSLRFNVLLLGFLALLPNLLVLAGYGTHLDMRIYNAYVWMAYGPVALILTLIEHLVLRTYREGLNLRQDAETDPLTRALNRRGLRRLGESVLQRAAAGGRRLGVLFIDADHFKAINDRFGHHCGDRVLRELSARIEQCIRMEDVLARFGGEEFVVLLPGVDAARAQVIAERICGAVAERPFTGDGNDDTDPVDITVSIGLATSTTGEAADTLEALIDQADQAAYKAKLGGRNRVEVLA
ncbi:GGDEF domain-containing protein [Methylonatrum kenyense]|uniref:GGDEF domain-containing protein n=1 Tax=Methylonatrum kenyense TaxID=455253 RepID=UPI0020C0A6DB|nr:GGDEF domain-containing protein [Methylonatrum kenyense]MCK8515351.1 GGDEF domain-containing protein [Methylonatrum kenyense]